ncbi:MAG TPA: DUF3237 domain-containing protein [Clostridia bacterium]|nr:DUF3237 domain-containing protein [Clostridia bacterium]
MVELKAEHVLHIHVQCTDGLLVGDSVQGSLCVIPIAGGNFTGKDIKGRVVPGGADWNTRVSDKVSHVFAKYMIQTDDGEYIAIENAGILNDADSDRVIKTSPRFTARKGSKYEWLNDGIYVGSLEVSNDPQYAIAVDINIYRML